MILYNRYFYQLFFRVLAFKCIIMSVFIIISETNVFNNKNTNTVITNLILQYQSLITVTIICLIPIIYMFASSVFGLFNLEIYKYYGIYSENNTDPYSLVFLTSFMTKIIFPLCLNSLQVLDIHGTSIQNILNVGKIIPVLGKFFPKFFPAVLILFCFLHFFDLAGKGLKGLGLNYVLYNSYKEENRAVKEGRVILMELKNDIENENENDNN